MDYLWYKIFKKLRFLLIIWTSDNTLLEDFRHYLYYKMKFKHVERKESWGTFHNLTLCLNPKGKRRNTYFQKVLSYHSYLTPHISFPKKYKPSYPMVLKHKSILVLMLPIICCNFSWWNHRDHSYDHYQLVERTIGRICFQYYILEFKDY